MTYSISEGISQKGLTIWLKDAKQNYGVFEDGRVNYTNADIAPVVMCTVIYNDSILLAKRGYGLADAEGYWSTIDGFIDEIKSITEQVMQEVKEELGLNINRSQVKIGESYTLKNPQERRTYIVFPCLVSLKKEPDIVLNEEHTEFAWIRRNDLRLYHTLDDLPLAIDSALKLK